MEAPFPTRRANLIRLEPAMQTVFLILAITILVIIAYCDAHTRRIPNGLSGAIAALGLVRVTLAHDLVAAGYTLAAGVVVLTAAFLLFSRGIIGGGDAKLVAAMALLIGYHDLFGFLLLMSLCGGVLAIAVLTRDILRGPLWHVFRRIWRPSAIRGVAWIMPLTRSTVPYGVAIAAAGVLTLVVETTSVP
jgi:prepilin peptidase CpaA